MLHCVSAVGQLPTRSGAMTVRNPATAPYNSTKTGSAPTPYRRRLEGKFMRRLTGALQAVHFWQNRKSHRVYRTTDWIN